jgi:threonine/homoserine/homoserine lactone efflux protein
MNELMSSIIPMFGFAFATSVSPGPVNIIAAMTGARAGALASFRFVLGATLTFVLMLGLLGSGLGVVVSGNKVLGRVLGAVGAAYILCLAWKIAFADWGGVKVNNTVPQKIPGILDGVIAQVLNPKAWIVSLSAVSVYVSTADNYLLSLMLLCGIYFFVCLPSL